MTTKRKSKKDFGSNTEYRAWLKRSKAAKKGVVTRELNRLKRVRTKAVKAKIPKSEKEWKKQIAAAIKKDRANRDKKKASRKPKYDDRTGDVDTTGWVPIFKKGENGVPPEAVRLDGKLALFPSRARLLLSAWKLHIILVKAEKKGQLAKYAKMMSEDYGMTLKEIYTLRYSP